MIVQIWSENTAVQIYFKNSLFSVSVPISEEKKTNPRKPYLNISARLVASSCSISGGVHNLVSCHVLSALNLPACRDTSESLRSLKITKFASVIFMLGLVRSGYTRSSIEIIII
jgi:hypothetical protein